MSLLIETKNTSAQTIEPQQIVNLGNVTRKYCKKINGVKAFDFNGNSISLQHTGIYLVITTMAITSAETGNAVIQLYANDYAVNGAIATENIATADQNRAMTILSFILVDSNCVLGTQAVNTVNLTLRNVGTIDVEIDNIVVDILKVV